MMNDNAWINDCKTVGPVAVCQALGLQVKGRIVGQCPACNVGGRKSGAKVYVADNAGRWHCHRCKEGGDMIDLVRRVTGCTFPEVRAWFASNGWCQASDNRPANAPRPKPRPRQAAQEPRALSYPPLDEVHRVLASRIAPIHSDMLSAWLWQRLGNDWAKVGALCGELQGQLPRWASFRRQSWKQTGHLAIFPVYDADGIAKSVRARRVVGGGTPKTLPPAGHSCGGLVLADYHGRAMLMGRRLPRLIACPVPHIVITEGEPALMAWAMAGARATFGVGSGWWTQAHADKIPTGSSVLIATDVGDADGTGDRYASKILDTLKGRCKVQRWTGDPAMKGQA